MKLLGLKNTFVEVQAELDEHEDRVRQLRRTLSDGDLPRQMPQCLSEQAPRMHHEQHQQQHRHQCQQKQQDLMLQPQLFQSQFVQQQPSQQQRMLLQQLQQPNHHQQLLQLQTPSPALLGRYQGQEQQHPQSQLPQLPQLPLPQLPQVQQVPQVPQHMLLWPSGEQTMQILAPFPSAQLPTLVAVQPAISGTAAIPPSAQASAFQATPQKSVHENEIRTPVKVARRRRGRRSGLNTPQKFKSQSAEPVQDAREIVMTQMPQTAERQAPPSVIEDFLRRVGPLDALNFAVSPTSLLASQKSFQELLTGSASKRSRSHSSSGSSSLSSSDSESEMRFELIQKFRQY